MKIHYIVISIILVSILVLGSTSYINNLGNNYGHSADLSGFNNTQERLVIQQDNAQSLSDEITGFKLESVTDFLDIPYKMIKIGWKIGKNMFGSWKTIEVILVETTENMTDVGIPLPDWLLPSIISIIILTLAAIILYAWYKWKFED